jgi:Na+/melibiose symporter-like transporter
MLVIFLTGMVLKWSGYVENAAQQTVQTLTAIRLIISVLPALVLLVSIVIAGRYSLTRQKHAQIQEELRQRRSAAA